MKDKILLVEDEISLAHNLKLNLELEGFSVNTVGDGASAIKAFGEEKFDMVILDIMIPNIDGITVCENIRLKDNHTPILFLSAKNTVEDRVIGLKKGGDDYLVKPFNLEELILRVDKLISRNKANITYPSHPFAEKGVVALSEMIKEPFLIREEGSGTRISLRNEFKKRGIDESDINILLELGSTGVIKQAVMDRQGISIVNQQSVQRELKSGLLKEVQIKDFELTKQFYLVLHKRTTKSRVLETFLAFLKQY